MFDKQPKELLGIDIGTKQIKVVELKRDQAKPVLENYAIASIQNAKLYEMPSAQIADILKQMLYRAGIKTKQAVMSLPAYSTFLALIKIADLPGTEQELEQRIQIEAKKYVPVPLSEVTLGWTKLKKDILLIAVPKDIVNRYAQIAKQADLELKAMEAEHFALARSLAGFEKDTVMIIDAGSRSTNVSLVEQGKVKTNRTLENPDIEQIKQLILPEAKKIILTGGRINQEIKNSLPNSQIGNPWQNVVYSDTLKEKLIELSPFFATALGLALRDLNG